MTDTTFEPQDYDDEYATFGDRVAAGREQLGITQGQLAKRLGVKIQTLQNWEEDRSEPRANKLQMLAGMLNVSIIWLMSGQGDGLDPAFGSIEEQSDNTQEILMEVRSIREAQLQLNARMGRLEKRLRAALG